MTTTSRWYILAREIADGQSDYVFLGSTQDKDRANAKVDAEPEGREALKINAGSRRQAADYLPQVYDGRRVKGWISPEDKKAGQALVKAMVMRQMFCPYTHVILDMRRAVVVQGAARTFVMAADHWDAVKADVLATYEARGRAHVVKVYDGRELFKR